MPECVRVLYTEVSEDSIWSYTLSHPNDLVMQPKLR